LQFGKGAGYSRHDKRMAPIGNPKPEVRNPHWLLRRADQAGVAVFVLLGLAATVGWWISRGGLSGRLIEVEKAQPQTASFQIDINEADWPELAALPGVGRTLAERIVQSRQTQGPFLDHEDLRRVRGIGPKTLDRIRPYLRPVPDGRELAGR
jgi:competence protein ComEA